MKRVMLFVVSVMLLAAVSVQAQEIIRWTDDVYVRGTARFVAARNFNSGTVRIGQLDSNFSEVFSG